MMRDAEAADAGQRLRESAGHEVDAVEYALFFRAPEPLVVRRHQRSGPVDRGRRSASADCALTPQGTDVATDRIQSLSDHQAVRRLLNPLQFFARSAGSCV